MAANDEVATGGEPDEPGLTQCREASWVSEVLRDQPPDLCAQHVRQRQSQSREGPVQLAEELVLQRRARLDPAGAVMNPRGQLAEDERAIGDQAALSSQHQLGDGL